MRASAAFRRPFHAALAALLALLALPGGPTAEGGPEDVPLVGEERPLLRFSPFPPPVTTPLPGCKTREHLVGRNQPVGPSAALAGVLRGPFASLGGTATDTPFATTLAFEAQRCVTAAELTLRVRPIGSAGNDQLVLGDVAGGTRWSAYFGSGSGNNVPAFPALTPGGGAWGGQPAQTFRLDLLALPQGTTSQVTSLRSVLEGGRLDVYVQDDTSVEAVELRLTVCPCVGRICVTKFDDLNGDGRRDRGEPLLPDVKLHVRDGGATDLTQATNAREPVCFDVPAPGTYTVTESVPTGWVRTTPASGGYRGDVKPGMTYHLLFGNRRCPARELLVGRPDDFVNGGTGEGAPSPGAALTAVVGTPAATWDSGATDAAFGHTFILPAGGCLVAATLEIRLKPVGGEVGNDGFALGCAAVAGFPRWTGWIGKGSNGGSGAALQPGAWSLASPSTTFTVPLSAFATNAPAGPSQSLLALLDARRSLDVYVQDDTAVDYVKLTYTICPCDRPIAELPTPADPR